MTNHQTRGDQVGETHTQVFRREHPEDVTRSADRFRGMHPSGPTLALTGLILILEGPGTSQALSNWKPTV